MGRLYLFSNSRLPVVREGQVNLLIYQLRYRAAGVIMTSKGEGEEQQEPPGGRKFIHRGRHQFA